QPPDPDFGKASGHLLIELVLLLARQPVGFLGNDPRLLLGDVAGLHRPIGLGPVQKQGARELQQSVAARAGALSGQSDLGAASAPRCVWLGSSSSTSRCLRCISMLRVA